MGGVLSAPTHELNISVLPTDIPESIEIDVSELDINHSMRLSDLTRPRASPSSTIPRARSWPRSPRRRRRRSPSRRRRRGRRGCRGRGRRGGRRGRGRRGSRREPEGSEARAGRAAAPALARAVARPPGGRPGQSRPSLPRHAAQPWPARGGAARRRLGRPPGRADGRRARLRDGDRAAGAAGPRDLHERLRPPVAPAMRFYKLPPERSWSCTTRSTCSWATSGPRRAEVWRGTTVCARWPERWAAGLRARPPGHRQARPRRPQAGRRLGAASVRPGRRRRGDGAAGRGLR